MGNFEIFSLSGGLWMTLAAFACLFLAGVIAAKEKRLTVPVGFLLTAFVLDFGATGVEAWAFSAYEQGDEVSLLIMFELVLFLISMIFMSLAAAHFISDSTHADSNMPVWILGAVGGGAIILFTIVMPAGEMVNNMRLIFPLAAFVYLSVGLAARLSSPHRLGYGVGLLATIGLIGLTVCKFFNVYAPWYVTPISYIVYAFCFLLMKSDELTDTVDKIHSEIENYHQRIKDIIKLSPFPIVISRLSDDKIILANNNALKLFGIKSDEMDKYRLKDFFADSDNRRLMLEQIEEQKEVQDFEVLIKTSNTNTPFWLLASANIIDYDYDLALYSAFQDITSRKNREAILQNQATRDPLTALYNRRYFEEEVPKQIRLAKERRQAYSVLMLDADFFKKVNDTYGHKTGDKVLIELSSRTEKALRDKDIVARYGGEEFVVFLPEINAAKARKVADRLRQSIASIVIYSDNHQKVTFTVSIGVSSSEISDNVDMLVKTADEALYKAKQNGRNRVEVFTPEDLKHFEEQAEQLNNKERDNQHPIFDKDNSAEISLLDGVDTKDMAEPVQNKEEL
jgi:diguanylate cyclase (GGDEF)-like protein/PAS domain S-box-containing protein